MPEREYGEWTRGNSGQVGRTVTTWHPSVLGTMPLVAWEPHPDEPTDHRDDCRCASCELMAETRGRGG